MSLSEATGTKPLREEFNWARTNPATAAFPIHNSVVVPTCVAWQVSRLTLGNWLGAARFDVSSPSPVPVPRLRSRCRGRTSCGGSHLQSQAKTAAKTRAAVRCRRDRHGKRLVPALGPTKTWTQKTGPKNRLWPKGQTSDNWTQNPKISPDMELTEKEEKKQNTQRGPSAGRREFHRDAQLPRLLQDLDAKAELLRT